MGAALVLALSLAVCNRHRIGGVFNTRFGDVKVVDGRIVEDGAPLSGTLEARDAEVHSLAAQIFAGTGVERWIDIPTQGLILELPVEDGLAEGEAVLFVDVKALASGDLLAFEGYKVTAAQVSGARLKVATAAFAAGKLDGPVVIWKPQAADLELHKWAEATFENNEPHGGARLFYDGSEQVHRQYNFEHGTEVGTRQVFYRSGQVQAEVTLIEGKPHGDDKTYYRDGATRSHTVYADGVPQRAQEWFPDGSPQSEVSFADGASTTTRTWYSNGAVARTVDSDGVEQVFPAQGVVREYYFDGALRSEQTFDGGGVPDGPFRRMYADATVWEESTYRAGVREGVHKKWWKNGQLALSSQWSNGALHGEYNRWYASGDPWEQATYVEGKRMGRHQKWWKNGTVALDHTYTARGLNGEYRTHYDDGSLWAEGRYKDGKPVGTMKRWFPDGKLGFEQEHANRRPHGVHNRWWADGSPRLKATYVDGKLHGEFMNWLEDGTLHESATYEHGKLTMSTLHPVAPSPRPSSP